MKQKRYIATWIVVCLGLLFIIYYFLPFDLGNKSQTFLTIATFIFAIFAGFFISRQGFRYSNIRDQVGQFDGELTAIYRQFGHLSSPGQKRVKKIIEKHYKDILKHKKWDYHFVHKSATLTSIHGVLEAVVKDRQLKSLKHIAVQRISSSLRDLQTVRKKMVSLHNERIPRLQWGLIYFLALVLLAAVSSIPSRLDVFGAVLKASFVGSVVFVMFLLREFDNLRFFETTIGERSARDILGILNGKK